MKFLTTAWCVRCLSFVAVVVAAMLLTAGKFVAPATGVPSAADLLVVLGGDEGPRAKMAASLFSDSVAPRILLTGISGDTANLSSQYLHWRAGYLTDNGIADAPLLYDASARNSWEEAVNTLSIMRKHGWHRAVVVSDPPHMRRLSWVWHKVFHDTGFEFQLVQANMPGWNASWWFLEKSSASFVLREMIKFPYYLIRY